jgi:hypothetical protein
MSTYRCPHRRIFCRAEIFLSPFEEHSCMLRREKENSLYLYDLHYSRLRADAGEYWLPEVA